MLPSKRAERGFTLLEAVLAVAALAMIAIPILGSYSKANLLATNAASSLEQTEFAHSLIEELTVAGPLEATEQVYRDRFAYSVTVVEEPIDPTNRFSDVLIMFRVTVLVDDLTSPTAPTEIVHLIARDHQ